MPNLSETNRTYNAYISSRTPRERTITTLETIGSTSNFDREFEEYMRRFVNSFIQKHCYSIKPKRKVINIQDFGKEI